MRLLIDTNLSPKVAASLSKAGLESVHGGDVGLLTALDRGILEYAAANALVIISADSDFGELLAAARGIVREICHGVYSGGPCDAELSLVAMAYGIGSSARMKLRQWASVRLSPGLRSSPKCMTRLRTTRAASR